MQIKTLNTANETIEYSIYGEGEPILFIHGGHSNAKETLFHKGLSIDKFTFITPSRPGYGNTPVSDNRDPINSAKQIMRLMDNLNFNKFYLVGISAGGLTAIAIASLFPERTKKLVLASAVTKRWLKPGEILYRVSRTLFNPKIEKYVWGAVKFFSKVFPKLIASVMAKELSTKSIKHITNEELEELNAFLHSSRSKNGFIADLEHDLDEKIIENIKVPTLIVHSKNDKAVNKGHPLHAKKKIQNSKVIWVDNKWGHLLWVGKESKEIIDFVEEFLLEEDKQT